MAYEKDEHEIGALWLKQSAKGTEYLSGEINGVKVVCFRAKPTEKGPSWRVLKSQPREDREEQPARDAYDDLPSNRARGNDRGRW